MLRFNLLMWSFTVPVSLALLLAAISNYAPFHLPPPYEQYQIQKTPAWNRPGPLTGNLSVNHELENADALFKDKVIGPETIIFDKEGTMYLFTEKGIFIAKPDGDGFHDPTLLVEIKGGRPLSGTFDSEGNIYFCDVILGLGKLNMTDVSYEILVSSDQIYFCDDVVVSSKGEVYISDATAFRAERPEMVLLACQCSILSGGMTSRLLKYTPSTKTLEVLINDLTFAAGLEISADETYVLVNDGTRLRVLKYWLEGPSKGTTEVFIEGLPGYGDGIQKGSNSTYWVAVFEAMGYAQQILQSSRLLRWLAFQVPPEIAWSTVVMHGIILQVDEQGTVLRSFHDPSGGFGMTTTAMERNGKLYIGSFNHYVKVITL